MNEQDFVNYFTRRLESGDIPPEEVATRLVRYGLMDKWAFFAEVGERIELERAENDN